MGGRFHGGISVYLWIRKNAGKHQWKPNVEILIQKFKKKLFGFFFPFETNEE